jgi:hypothetical protein
MVGVAQGGLRRRRPLPTKIKSYREIGKKLFQYSRLILTTIEQSRRTNKVLFCRKANLRIPERTVEEEEETGKKI